MASDVKPRVKIPDKATPGETITIKTLISHPMESGQRRDRDGKVVPRSIINRFICEFSGETVIDIALEPAVSSNPYFAFEAKVLESGLFRFTWFDDDGSVHETVREIFVV